LNPFSLNWQRFVVAESAQSQVIGCGQVKIHSDGSRELASIVVAPDWRLRGVGKAIIEHLLKTHLPPLYLTCRASLGPFYVRFGFRAIQEASMPRYFRIVSRFFRLLQRLRPHAEGLLVMRLPR
jgi:N-acetylglutamate synthase-like GNAT family acetyltransferase